MVDNRERLPRGRRALTMNNEHERAVPSPLATRPTAVPLNVVALELSLSPSRVFAPCHPFLYGGKRYAFLYGFDGFWSEEKFG